MDNENRTVDDIIAVNRAIYQGCEECSLSDKDVKWFLDLLDNIAAAHKREIEHQAVHNCELRAENRFCGLSDEIKARRREVKELRECLKEACDSVCFKCRFGNVSYPYYCGNNCDRMAKWRKALKGEMDDCPSRKDH